VSGGVLSGTSGNQLPSHKLPRRKKTMKIDKLNEKRIGMSGSFHICTLELCI